MPKKKEMSPDEISNNGYQSSYMDFRGGASWRIFRILAEFVEGFEFLADFKKEVTIFGSARVGQHDPSYKEARKLGELLGKNGFTVITGGGPGIMEAANRGAAESDGESVGLNIQLPKEQRINSYVKKGKGFYYFFARKVMLAASAQAYIFFPGGFGTIDELFELLMLIQTKKMMKLPIVLVGRTFWEGLFSWVRAEALEKRRFIENGDMNIFTIVETAEEAFEVIKGSKERTYF